MRTGVFVCAALVFAAPLAAQVRNDRGTGDVPRDMPRRIGESVNAKGAPRSVEVIRVPIPTELREANEIAYEVVPTDAFAIVGRRRGLLQPRISARDLLITLAIPAATNAGPYTAATVVFTATNVIVEVPVQVEIAAARALLFASLDSMRDAAVGERVNLRFRISNMGNAPDTVTLSVATPTGWSASEQHVSRHVIGTGGVADHSVALRVPREVGSGDFFIRARATSIDGQTYSAVVPVSVGTRPSLIAPPGPTLRVGSSAVLNSQGAPVWVNQIALSGPVTSSINVDGRFTTEPELRSAGLRALAHVGTYASRPHVTAWTSDWRVNAGNTSSMFGELTGVNASGRGVTFEHHSETQHMQFMAAQPVNALNRTNDPQQLGGAYSRTIDLGTISASAATLSNGAAIEQTLDAIGVGLRSNDLGFGVVQGDIAYRNWSQGSGIGWALAAMRERPRDQATVRLIHAPGGTSAFARAADELQASGVYDFDERWNLAGSLFIASDRGARGQTSVRSRSLHLVPQYRVREDLTLRTEIRASAYNVAAEPVGFGNSETQLAATALGRYRGFSYAAGVGAGRVARSVEGADFGSEGGYRMELSARAGRYFALGSIQLDLQYARNSAATGYLPSQLTFAARADRVQIPHTPAGMLFDVEWTHQRWSDAGGLNVLRSTINYGLAGGFSLAGSVERNPLLHSGSNAVPWVFALAVERRFGLPRVGYGVARGAVFQDLNGNGRRDDGEPGMPNVRLRRGDAHAISDRDGSYRFWEQGRGKLAVDYMTLPQGWIVGEIGKSDVALIPTTNVEVTLALGAAERLRGVNLTNAVVIARDSAGREWAARRPGPESAVFEALPVGIYTIDVNFDAVREPLRVDGAAPIINVTNQSHVRITVPVAGRPLRFRSNN